MKKSLLCFVFLAFNFFLYPQSFLEKEINIADSLATDVAVLGGNISCQPIRTSYGYAATGEGRQLYGFTQEGKILWQTAIQDRNVKFLSVFAEDQLCTVSVSVDSKLSLLNSSGLLLWSSSVDFIVEDSPLQGIDGRIFVRGERNLACFGMKGTQRWIISTENQDLSVKPAALNDGSIAVFMNEASDGKFSMQRFSPYGKLLEILQWNSKPIQAETIQDGMLVAFEDGLIQKLSVENDKIKKLWKIDSKNSKIDSPAKLIPDKKNNETAIVYGSPSKIVVVKNAAGKILKEFRTEIESRKFKYTTVSAQGITICTETNGYCYRKDGSIIWKVKFDPSKKIKYLFTSDSGYIVFCNDNWSMELFQTRLNLNKNTNSFVPYKLKQIENKVEKNYVPSSTQYGQLIDEELLEKMKKDFEDGNYPDKEEQFTAMLSAELKQMSREWFEIKSRELHEELFFDSNVEYSRKIFEILGESQIILCRSELISMIRNVSDPYLLQQVIQCAGKMSWDPDGQILKTIDYLMNTKKIGPKDTAILNAIADATFEICRFMGRPSFFSMGSKILGYMLFPQFPDEIRHKAIETMEKIKESKL